MKPLAPNTTLQNRYKITEMIGKGGMGEVYLAIDQRLGHSIALKRTTVSEDVLLAEAFENEAKTLALLRHSVLPKVSDHFFENDQQFLIMEYISGEDLSERLKATDKAFPLNWVMFWADQLLDALSYLHTYDPPIIHRDIKPQNLKLTSENNIVLLDFGLSKNTLGHTKVTTSGSVVGYTPHYASMEQIRGTGTNAKSDIFSLSATLYHLLANESPVDALTRADAMLAGSPDPLKPLTLLNPEIDQTISDAIQTGMELSQEKRFDNARDMQKTLRRAYNKIQKSMAEPTVAFNAENLETSEAAPINEVVTDTPQIRTTVNDKHADPTLVGGFRPTDTSLEKTEAIESEDFQAIVGEQDLDAVVDVKNFESVSDKGNVNNAPAEEVPNKQNAKNLTTNEDIKPEVPVVQDSNRTQQLSVDESEFKTTEDFSANDYRTKEEVTVQRNLKSDVPVPVVPTETDSVTDQPNNEVTNDLISERTPEVGVENEEPTVVKKTALETNVAADLDTSNKISPPKQKSSTGKYVALFGGLALLLIMFLGAAFGGIYYYTDGTFSFDKNDSATTKPESETTTEPKPQIESNPEVVDDGTGDSETDETVSKDETTDGTETDADDTGSDEPDSETESKPNVSQTGKTTTKKTVPTKKTSSQPTKKTVTKTNRPKTKTTTKPKNKTTKPPAKKPKKKKKDAGVL